MFFEKVPFSTTGEFIEHVKAKKEIIGVVEYGSRKCDDMTLGGDYDISIILENSASSNFNGIHFYIGGIPVDCMILTLAELETKSPSSSMLLAHVKCKILYDKNGKVKEAIRNISDTWKSISNIEDWEISFYRFFFKHTLDKIENRLFMDELFSRYSISLAATIIIEAYERLNHLEPGKPRNVFNAIRENDEYLFKEIGKIFENSELKTQFSALKNATNHILLDYGGNWQDNEQLFHLKYRGKNDECEQQRIIDLIFK